MSSCTIRPTASVGRIELEVIRSRSGGEWFSSTIRIAKMTPMRHDQSDEDAPIVDHTRGLSAASAQNLSVERAFAADQMSLDDRHAPFAAARESPRRDLAGRSRPELDRVEMPLQRLK